MDKQKYQDRAKKGLSNLIQQQYDFKERLARINDLIIQGIDYIQDLPNRWYVENPNQNVIDYLVENEIMERPKVIHEDCGYGMIYGNFAFIPYDVNYSWEITQEQFDYFYYNIYQKQEKND